MTQTLGQATAGRFHYLRAKRAASAMKQSVAVRDWIAAREWAAEIDHIVDGWASDTLDDPAKAEQALREAGE